MFALLAVIVFAVDFVLGLVGTNSGKFDLIALGLALLATHFLIGGSFALPAFRRRE